MLKILTTLLKSYHLLVPTLTQSTLNPGTRWLKFRLKSLRIKFRWKKEWRNKRKLPSRKLNRELNTLP